MGGSIPISIASSHEAFENPIGLFQIFANEMAIQRREFTSQISNLINFNMERDKMLAQIELQRLKTQEAQAKAQQLALSQVEDTIKKSAKTKKKSSRSSRDHC